MNGIKVQYGNQTKRISETVESFSVMIELIKKIFGLESIVKGDDSLIKIYYINKNSADKIEIASEEGFKDIVMHYGKDEKSLMKFEVTISALQSVDIDDLLNNVNISESFSMPAKKGMYAKTEKKAMELNATKKEEKEVKCIKKEDTYLKISNLSNLDDVLVSKIEEVISSRMKLMENNVTKMMASQVNNLSQSQMSKSLKDMTGSRFESSNLCAINSENMCFAPKENTSVDNIKGMINDDQDSDIYSSLAYPHGQIANAFYSNEYCDNCKFQIIQNKYVCVICDNYKLCSKCEKNHNEQHPMLKINITQKTITNKQELASYFAGNSKITESPKMGILTAVKNIFNKSKKESVYIALTLHGRYSFFAMAQSESTKIKIQIESPKDIPEEILIIPQNNNSLKVQSGSINSIKAGEVKYVDLQIEAPNTIGIYDFEISAQIKNLHLICVPLRLEITVVEKEELDVTNANLLFTSYEDILNLRVNEKILLYKTVVSHLTSRSLDEIYTMLIESNFNVEATIGRLIQEEGDGRNDLNK